MARLFEVVEVTEDLPKFFVVGESSIAAGLTRNLLSGGAQVYWLSGDIGFSHANLYKIAPTQIAHVSRDIANVFFDKEPNYRLEFDIKENLPQAKLIYLNPHSLKENAYMLFSPFIYGPGAIDRSFGFLAMNERNIIENKTLILPANIDEEIRPIFVTDVVEIVEKIMFSRPPDNLILLSGKEPVSLIHFLGDLKARLQGAIQTRYLEQKLSFRLPNAGHHEQGTTSIDKGLSETAAYLNAETLKVRVVPPPPPPKKIVAEETQRDVVFPSPPRRIPVIAKADDDETEFAINNNFIKHVYHQNLEFLKQNNLYQKSENTPRLKIKEKNFAVQLNQKKQSLNIFFGKCRSLIRNLPDKMGSIFAKETHFGKRALRVGARIFSWLFLFLFLAALPYLFFIISFSSSLFFFKESAINFAGFNLTKTKSNLSLSKNLYTAAVFTHEKVLWPYYQVLGKDASFQNLSRLLQLEENGLSILENGQDAALSATKTIPAILDKSESRDRDIDNLLQNTLADLSETREVAASTLATLKHQIPRLPWFLRAKNQEYYGAFNALPMFYKKLNEMNLVMKEVPTLLGQHEKKTYAVVFQNNMELRATGGFIGSFALISFEKEKLVDFSIYDVYDADGQLKGRVVPPPEILHFLGQPNWFLRDANVSPDFPTSAEQIGWFLEKEMKAKVDGVAAIDISFVENLLSVTGPIYLADFQETVNAGNLFEKAERAAENEYFPGSQKKRNYLASLSQQLWNRVLELNGVQVPQALKVAMEAAQTRHLQAFFADANLQNTVQFLHADGRLINDKKNYLAIIENNYGANKANYFVKRHINHVIKILPDSFVEHEVRLEYENLSPTSLWPTGTYKPYVKFYVPATSIFKNFTWQNKKTKLSEFLNEQVLEEWKVQTEQLVLDGQENDLMYFGSFLEIPVKEKRTVTFSFQTKMPDAGNLKQFEYYFQKQAGIVRDEYDLTVLFPDDFTPKSNFAPSLAAKGKLQYNLNTEKDIDLKINFE